MRAKGGLKHDDPLGAGQPAVLAPPRDRIPGDPLRTPVTTRQTARVGGGSDTRALDAAPDHVTSMGCGQRTSAATIARTPLTVVPRRRLLAREPTLL
jgi:hypothetical protein